MFTLKISLTNNLHVQIEIRSFNLFASNERIRRDNQEINPVNVPFNIPGIVVPARRRGCRGGEKLIFDNNNLAKRMRYDK